MREILRVRPLEREDYSILAYVQLMARTAQSEAARLVFKSYLEQEMQRLGEVNGGAPAPAGTASNAE